MIYDASLHIRLLLCLEEYKFELDILFHLKLNCGLPHKGISTRKERCAPFVVLVYGYVEIIAKSNQVVMKWIIGNVIFFVQKCIILEYIDRF